MPYQPILTRRARTFTPPEAYEIARQLRSLGQTTHDLGRQAASLLQGLNSDWQGRSRERFFQVYASLPRRADGAGSLAGRRAGQIESMKVTVWETAWEMVWQADSPLND